MIKYQLRCDLDHEFEGWFRNSADYDEQSGAGLLMCPVCGSEHVSKAIMAPAIPKKSNTGRIEQPESGAVEKPNRGSQVITRDHARLEAMRQDIIAAAERARDYVEKNFDYVGDQFSEEARKMHYGETEERGIYGEANGEDVQELIEEGINIAPLPKPRKPEVIKKTDKKKLN